MIRPILKFNKSEDLENLKRPSVEITAFDDILKGWAKDLIETTKASHCYGVAAPQIGINIEMFCIERDGGYEIFINPRVITATGRIKFEERCLSFPGLAVKTKRKSLIQIEYQDVEGNHQQYLANGIEAVCIQHEMDHLNGLLLSDQGALYKVK